MLYPIITGSNLQPLRKAEIELKGLQVFFRSVFLLEFHSFLFIFLGDLSESDVAVSGGVRDGGDWGAVISLSF